MKLIEQNEHSECGIACITMILSYYKFQHYPR
ncbi:cysteine peptidase family C39 domain-containing protein [Staphylococcus aureus]